MAARVYKWFIGIVEAAAILLACAMVLPQIFGVKCFAVTSASMTPAYPVGCVVYCVPVDPETIEPGDVISFRMGKTTATHRVVAADRTERTFTTKGDANNTPDGAPVSFSRVIGKVVFSLPLLGYVAMWITVKRLVIVVIIMVLLMLVPFGTERQKKKEDPVADGNKDIPNEEQP